MKLAFRRLVTLPRSGLLLLCADCPNASALKKVAMSPVETFGLSDAADWRATDITVSDAGQSFTVWRGEPFAAVSLPLWPTTLGTCAAAAIASASAFRRRRLPRHCGNSAASAPRDFR